MNTIQILCTMRIVLAIEKIIFYKHFQQPFFRTGTGDGIQNSFNILMTSKASQNSQKLTQFFGRKRSRLNLLAPLALHCERLQQCREEQPLLTTSQLLILLVGTTTALQATAPLLTTSIFVENHYYYYYYFNSSTSSTIALLLCYTSGLL